MKLDEKVIGIGCLVGSMTAFNPMMMKFLQMKFQQEKLIKCGQKIIIINPVLKNTGHEIL